MRNQQQQNSTETEPTGTPADKAQPDISLSKDKSYNPFFLLKRFIVCLWHFHRKLIISLVITFAVILLSFRALAFYLEKNPQIVQQFIMEQLHAQVTFDSLQVNINLFFPSLSMHNFSYKNLHEEQNLFQFDTAKIRLDSVLSIFHRQLKIDKICIDGAHVIVRRNKNNEFLIADYQLAKKHTKTHRSSDNIQSYLAFLNQANFDLTGSEIYFVDDIGEIPSASISDINFEMKNTFSRHQMALSAKLSESDTHLDLRLDFNAQVKDIKKWSGRVYGAINNLQQKTLLHFLKQEIFQIEQFEIQGIKTDIQFWSTIDSGKLQSAYGIFNIVDANLNRADNDKQLHLDKLSTNFQLNRNNYPPSESEQKTTAWKLDLFNLNLIVDAQQYSEKFMNFTFNKLKNAPLSKIQIFLDDIDIREISPVISFFLPKDSQEIYDLINPQGSLKNLLSSFYINTSKMPLDINKYQFQAELSEFSMNAFKSLPEIHNLSSRFIFNEVMGRAYIDSRNMELHLKSLFRDSWPVTEFSGEFFWQQEGDEWLVGGERLNLINPHLNAHADLDLWIAESGQAFLDLTGFYDNANVKYVPFYLPAKIMDKGLVKWLDNAFVSGMGTDGGVVFRGEFSQFPFTHYDGVMDIVFNTKDVLLDYTKGWPKLRDIDALVQFTERGMNVESRKSRLFSSNSKNIKANIANYFDQILKVKGDINSNVKDGTRFLKQAELVSDDVIEILDAKGNIDINMDVTVPLSNNTAADSKIKVKLKNIDYYPPGFERKDNMVKHLNGEILIHNQTINAPNLSAKIMDKKATIAIKTENTTSLASDPDVSVVIDSKVSIEQLNKFALIPKMLIPLSKQLSGTTAINLAIDIPNKQRELAFKLSSDLTNLSSKLPSPLNKTAGDSSHFYLYFADIKPEKRTGSKKIQNNGKQAKLDIGIADILSLALLLDTSNDDYKLLKGNLAFTGEKAALPENDIFKINGHLFELPIEQWQSVFVSENNNTEIIQEKKHLFSIPIELAMTELVLPELDLEAPSSKTTTQKITSKKRAKIDPLFFPLINGYIDTIKLGKHDLGRFTIKSKRTSSGIVFDVFNLDGQLLAIEAKAKWYHGNNDTRIKLKAKATIPSVENLLITLNNEHLIRNGKAIVSGEISWPGGPGDINKEDLEGQLTLSVENGVWIEGKPGAVGRLLGLLNMNELLRRFSLDFSDVSKEGFQFDRIDSDANLKKGKLSTDNFRITAPSSVILMTGNINLVSSTLEQRVTVIPQVSASLPLAGAAVAGPAGAALVWVGQNILGEQLNQVTALDYTITGAWDDPVIKKDKTNKETLQKRIKTAFGMEQSKDKEQLKISRPATEQNTNPVFE